MIDRVEVDLVKCIGCGTCWVSVPKTFRESPDYKAEVTGDLDDAVLVRLAADGCPTLAITLFGSGGVVLFPTEEVRAARASSDWA